MSATNKGFEVALEKRIAEAKAERARIIGATQAATPVLLEDQVLFFECTKEGCSNKVTVPATVGRGPTSTDILLRPRMPAGGPFCNRLACQKAARDHGALLEMKAAGRVAILDKRIASGVPSLSAALFTHSPAATEQLEDVRKELREESRLPAPEPTTFHVGSRPHRHRSRSRSRERAPSATPPPAYPMETNDAVCTACRRLPATVQAVHEGAEHYVYCYGCYTECYAYVQVAGAKLDALHALPETDDEEEEERRLQQLEELGNASRTLDTCPLCRAPVSRYAP